MKYYVYVSESKISMLYSQIGKSENEQREVSLSLDLRVFKGELKESRGIPANKFTKLDAIVNRLTNEGLVGSLDKQQPYIQGQLKMTWASFGFSQSISSLLFHFGVISHTN